jgi:hypothetical protein
MEGNYQNRVALKNLSACTERAMQIDRHSNRLEVSDWRLPSVRLFNFGLWPST